MSFNQRQHSANEGGNRRADIRYPVQVALEYSIISGRRVIGTGHGHTINISNGGILFEPNQALAPGTDVELVIAWPAPPRNVHEFKVQAAGRVMRVQRKLTAVKMLHYAFVPRGAHRAARAETES